MKTLLYRILGPILIVLSIAGCATQTQTPNSPAAVATPSGPPKALLWVGNSFFYYNNSMHGHVALLTRGDKSHHAPRRVGDDQRFRHRLARRRELPRS